MLFQKIPFFHASKNIFCLSHLKNCPNCGSTCMHKMKKFCSSKVIMNQNSRLGDCHGVPDGVITGIVDAIM